MNDGDAREWYDRVPPDDEFKRRQDYLRRNGLLANVVIWNSYPYFGLEVIPLEQMPTNQPPWVGSPWHITLGIQGEHSKVYNPLIRDFQQRFARPKKVRLQFNYLKDNGYAQLDPKRDPIASDKQIKQLKALDPFQRGVDLHISM